MKKITKQDLKKALSVTLKALKTYWVLLVVVAVLLIVDLVTKAIVSSRMVEGESIKVIDSFFYITFILNDGAAFGMLSGKQWFFIPLTLIALVVFFYLLFNSKGTKKIYAISLVMVIAGTLGNFIDRVALGAVRDFFEIVYFGYNIPWLGSSFAIFNVADMCLVIGIIIFAVYVIFFSKDLEKVFEQKKKAREAKKAALQGEVQTVKTHNDDQTPPPQGDNTDEDQGE